LKRATPSPGRSYKYLIAVPSGGFPCKRQPYLAEVSILEGRREEAHPESLGFAAVYEALSKRMSIDSSAYEADYIAAPRLPQNSFHISENLGIAAETPEMDATFSANWKVVAAVVSHTIQ
jgi:hypothetical protein